MRRPDVFGKYQLLTRIASGGMAEVWLARSSSLGGFEKLLAIKRIRRSLADNEAFVSMFIAEAKLTVQLSHPNIVQIFDFGKVDDDYFMAMEYVEGADLSQIARQARRRGTPLPVGTCVYIMKQVMDGLAYAHGRPAGPGQLGTIIHRDVSPQNILVSYDGHVKVNDFGIAKAAHEIDQDNHEIFGKLAYVSPEQCRGEPADVACDIWSAGVVLHELLANRRLFARPEDSETMDAVEKMPIPRPSAFNVDVPPELDQLVLATLDRDAGRRLRSARDAAMKLHMIQGQHFPTHTGFHLQEVIRLLWDGHPPRIVPDENDSIDDTHRNPSRSASRPLSSDRLSDHAAAAVAAARQMRHVKQDSDWNRPDRPPSGPAIEPTVASRPSRADELAALEAQPTELDLQSPFGRGSPTLATDTEIARLKRLFIADPNLWVLVDIGRRYADCGLLAKALGAYKLAAAKFAQGGLLVQAACIYREILDDRGSSPTLRDEIRRLPSTQGQSTAELLREVFRMEDDSADFSEYYDIFERDSKAIEVFHESPILASLNAEQFLSFVEAVSLRNFGGGTTILAEGDRGDSFFLLGRGRVVVSTENFEARKVYITSLSDGDCFGEQSYFTGEPRNATVEAFDGATVLEVSKDVLNQVTQEFPTVRESLRRFYKERIAESLLAKSPLFGHLDIKARRDLAERFTFESFPQDEVLIREGDLSDAFYAIKSGEVQVYTGDDDQPVAVAKLGAGEIFGEMAALEGSRRTASVRTKTVCELLRLEAAELNAMLSRNADIRRGIERTIAERRSGRSGPNQP